MLVDQAGSIVYVPAMGSKVCMLNVECPMIAVMDYEISFAEQIGWPWTDILTIIWKQHQYDTLGYDALNKVFMLPKLKVHIDSYLNRHVISSRNFLDTIFKEN